MISLQHRRRPGRYRLALPAGAYYTWGGRTFEGSPIEPDQTAVFDWRQSRLTNKNQLEVTILNSLQLLQVTPRGCDHQ